MKLVNENKKEWEWEQANHKTIKILIVIVNFFESVLLPTAIKTHQKMYKTKTQTKLECHISIILIMMFDCHE